MQPEYLNYIFVGYHVRCVLSNRQSVISLKQSVYDLQELTYGFVTILLLFHFVIVRLELVGYGVPRTSSTEQY